MYTPLTQGLSDLLKELWLSTIHSLKVWIRKSETSREKIPSVVRDILYTTREIGRTMGGDVFVEEPVRGPKI